VEVGGSIEWRGIIFGAEEDEGAGVGGRDGFAAGRSLRSLMHRRLVFPASNQTAIPVSTYLSARISAQTVISGVIN